MDLYHSIATELEYLADAWFNDGISTHPLKILRGNFGGFVEDSHKGHLVWETDIDGARIVCTIDDMKVYDQNNNLIFEKVMR